MKKTNDYHHGNLRDALITAGIEILDDVGWRGLSLRACATKAGVSHAAPAHHFGNLMGLQTALATLAFQRFNTALTEAMRKNPTNSQSRLQAAAQAYVTFAKDHKGLFQLMFGEATLDRDNQEFRATQDIAFNLLGELIHPFLPDGKNLDEDHKMRIALWSVVHGYAHLLISGNLNMLPISEDGLSHLPNAGLLVQSEKT